MSETFGNTEAFLSSSALTNVIRGGKYTCALGGVANSITIYIATGWSEGNKVKCAIYDAGRNFIATTEEKSTGLVNDAWNVFNFSNGPVLSVDTDYILVAWGEAGSIAAHDTDEANTFWSQGLIYGAWPATLDAPTSDWDRSIYCTYTSNQAPTAPTSLEVDGKSAPTGANCTSDLTPGFTAIFNDPDAGDQANAINIQVGTAAGLSDMWDSGWLADATVTPNRCTAKTYAGAALSAGTSYWWRSRFRDDDNEVGTWSAWQRFDICEGVPEGIGLQCIPGSPLPHRRPFTCAVRVPLLELGRRFPFEFPALQFPCH